MCDLFIMVCHDRRIRESCRDTLRRDALHTECKWMDMIKIYMREGIYDRQSNRAVHNSKI